MNLLYYRNNYIYVYSVRIYAKYQQEFHQYQKSLFFSETTFLLIKQKYNNLEKHFINPGNKQELKKITK